MGRRIVDIAGNKYGKLTVIEFSKTHKHHAYWLCRCECGNEVVIDGCDLRKNNTKSCGCLKRGRPASENKEHKQTYRERHPLYSVWCGMKTRCFNSNQPRYKDYGGRGITVCDEWLSFAAFANDMQNEYSPGLTLERIDNSKGYCKDNCRWATAKEQSWNKRNNVIVNYNGESVPLAKLCDTLNKNYFRAYNRIIRKGQEAELVLQNIM